MCERTEIPLLYYFASPLTDPHSTAILRRIPLEDLCLPTLFQHMIEQKWMIFFPSERSFTQKTDSFVRQAVMGFFRVLHWYIFQFSAASKLPLQSKWNNKMFELFQSCCSFGETIISTVIPDYIHLEIFCSWHFQAHFPYDFTYSKLVVINLILILIFHQIRFPVMWQI